MGVLNCSPSAASSWPLTYSHPISHEYPEADAEGQEAIHSDHTDVERFQPIVRHAESMRELMHCDVDRHQSSETDKHLDWTRRLPSKCEQ